MCIRDSIARDLAAAPTAAVYGRIGTCTQEFGTLASWLVDVVNVLTGNCDRPGGMLFGKPVAWSVASLPHPDFANGFTFHRWKSRVRGARRGAAGPRVHDQRRQLAERDDTPCARHPAGALRARAAALRRHDLALG